MSQNEHKTVPTEQFNTPAYPHSSINSTLAPATVHNVPVTAESVSATSTPSISVSGGVFSHAKPYAAESPRQLEPEIKGTAPQHKLLEHDGVDNIERSVGRSGTKHDSHFSAIRSKSTPVSNLAVPVCSASSLAPPPLSEALRVPGFDTPPFITPSVSNTLTSRPAFDVEAFINSLRRNQPQLNATSTVHAESSNSHSVAMSAFKAGASLSISQPHPLSQKQAANIHPSVGGQKERTIPMADLSVSLVSSTLDNDERNRREFSETVTETSEQTDSSEHRANSTIDPPEPVMSAGTEASGSAHVGLPPGYKLQHHGQGLTDQRPRPGWFALTSHLSHS